MNDMRATLFTAILCMLSIFITHGNDKHHGLECKYTHHDDTPEVYYINMDRSRSRKDNMDVHLKDVGFKSHRVRGLEPKEIYIPDDIQLTWHTRWCMLETKELIPNRDDVKYNTNSKYNGYTSLMMALCGRGKKKNTAKELGCTTSHIIAMYEAIYSKTATSRYALIIEDDVFFPFDIDYNVLAQSAPGGFGILQLFNSNLPTMKQSWESYVSNNSNLWVKRNLNKFDYWSTCGYLIDRVVMKDVIDRVFGIVNGWMSFKIIAGITSPCVPRECCYNDNSSGGKIIETFNHTTPCTYAPRGYQADSFLYAMTTTYMMTIPLISFGVGGNESTFHQDHVAMLHQPSQHQQRQYIAKLLNREVPLPSFATPACNTVDVFL